MGESNESDLKKEETVIAKHDTGLLVLDRELYLKMLDRVKDKEMVDKL